MKLRVNIRNELEIGIKVAAAHDHLEVSLFYM
jgi:hypothetical protein